MSFIIRAVVFVTCAACCVSAGGAGQPGRPVELHVWGLNMGYPRAGWLKIVAAFEARRPAVAVIVGPADRGSDLQKLLCGVVGDSPPDVFKREANLFGDIAARGILMPLDEFVEADKTRRDGLHKSDYKPGVWASCRGVGHRAGRRPKPAYGMRQSPAAGTRPALDRACSGATGTAL